jgi:uncharacterized protein (TIGR02453 family)
MSNAFTPASLKFLRSLARNNDREWFTPRKAIYEHELKEPMLALIEEINRAMSAFAPEHVRPPHKTMMRIYRDTRFSNDKRPYKSQVSAWWARRGMEKTSGGGYYMHVHPKEVVVAIGVFMPEREQMLAIRRWMAENHEAYRARVKALLKPRGKALPFAEIQRDALTRMPKGFAADHPAGDLLRAKNWGVRIALPAEAALAPEFAREVIARFKAATPLVHALNEAISRAAVEASDDERRPRKALF